MTLYTCDFPSEEEKQAALCGGLVPTVNNGQNWKCALLTQE